MTKQTSRNRVHSAYTQFGLISDFKYDDRLIGFSSDIRMKFYSPDLWNLLIDMHVSFSIAAAAVSQFPLLFSRRGGPEKPRWQFSINWKCQWPAAIKLPGILKGPLAQRIAGSSVCRWLLSVHCSFCGRPVARINYEKAPKFGIFWWHVPTIFSICHFLFSISDFQLPLCSFFFFFVAKVKYSALFTMYSCGLLWRQTKQMSKQFVFALLVCQCEWICRFLCVCTASCKLFLTHL